MDLDNPVIRDLFDDRKVCGRCAYCESAIYEGEDYCEWNDNDVHIDCFDEYAREVAHNERIIRTGGE